jgi:gliding motility-associated-like protein
VVHAPREQEGDGIQATYQGNCFQSPTILSVEEVCSPQRNEIEWTFEDGSTLKEKQVSYIFPKTGWNKITLRIKTYNQTRLAPVAGAVGGPLGGTITNALETLCTDSTIVDSIFIKPIPVFSLPDSFYVCLRNSPVIPTRINPDPTGGSSFDYRWLTTLEATFSTAPFYDFVIPQTFRLEITNNFDCVVTKQSKAVSGCEPVVYVPDIFTPNGDNTNDTFVTLPLYTNTYQLLIFNRWGEIVFESNDPDMRWDGSVRGKTIAPAVYTYQVRYTALDFPERGTIVKSGTVMVVK